MSKWSSEEFMEYLDELARAAGVPDSRRGTPNTTVLYDLTGVNPTQVGRWRAGTHQPTTESLRMVAGALAPRAGRSTTRVLADLEVKAGRRSEAEAQPSLFTPDPDTIEEQLKRARALALSADLPEAERASYMATVELYERDLKRMKDDLTDLMSRYRR